MVTREGARIEVFRNFKFLNGLYDVTCVREVVSIRLRVTRSNRVVPRFLLVIFRTSIFQGRAVRSLSSELNATLTLLTIFRLCAMVRRLLGLASMFERRRLFSHYVVIWSCFVRVFLLISFVVREVAPLFGSTSTPTVLLS